MTKSSKTDNLAADVIIIGGGPAGLSALSWCLDLGMLATLVEAGSEFGGQLLAIHGPISNYLGRAAKDGRELSEHFTSGISGLTANARLNARVTDFEPEPPGIIINKGEVLTGRAVVIATGVRRRRLDVPGEEEFFGRGIIRSGAENPSSVKGKRVAIIGGGDAALENASILCPYAEKVYLIHRREQFAARPKLIEKAKHCSNLEYLFTTNVLRFSGDDSLKSIELDRNSTITEVPVDAALIRIGVEPNSEPFRQDLVTDEKGYITIDSNCRTSSPNVFGVGDIACRFSPTIATAAGMGATAAKSIFLLLYGK